MKKFRDDDLGYLDWLHKNPVGFVVNCYKNPSSEYLMLHRATCWTISTPARTNWTTTGYIKVCSLNRNELEKWARRQVGGNLKACSFCTPTRREDTIDEAKALKLVKWISNKAIEGIPPLKPAKDLALEYQIDNNYTDNDDRVDSLINWETTKNFTSGFVTGLGGLLTLPVSVPAALGASWVIQARMVASIAIIYGHDIKEDKVRTIVLLSLVGDSINEVLKGAGLKITRKSMAKLISKVPGKALIKINKMVGFRLITKAGKTGIINLMKGGVPVVSGIVSGGFDAYTCRKIGYIAKGIFRKNK